MELGTVGKINQFVSELKTKLLNADKSSMTSETFGKESEYTYKGLLGGIDALIIDILALTKVSNKIVKTTTFHERNQISELLGHINDNFENPRNYIDQLESLKIIIRNFNIRNNSIRQKEYEVAIDTTMKIKLQLEQELVEVRKIKNKVVSTDKSFIERFEKSELKFQEIDKHIDDLLKEKENLTSQSENFSNILSNLSTLQHSAEESLNQINISKTEVSSNEKLIDSFAKRVQDREKKLEELEQKTDTNTTKLNEYETERVNLQKEAKELIKSAKDALNYKTAEGISASFQEKYNESRSKWRYYPWIFGAIFSILGAIGLGIWIVSGSTTDFGILIGRISLLPFPIIAAIFCANQYSKQKNLIEDYAYKMTLSKAIVGFSEQLKKNGSAENEEYVHYIKTALEEIHRDPLRKENKQKNAKNNYDAKEIVDIAEKIVKLTKSVE